MSYRFIKVTSYYESFLRQYKKTYPHLLALPYAQQYEHLMAARFGLSNYFQQAFRGINVDAHEIVVNAVDLQKAWAIENNIEYSDDPAFLIRQLKKLKAEIIFFENILSYNKEYLNEIRIGVPTLKKIIGNHSAPYKERDVAILKNCDFLVTCSPDINLEYKKLGAKSYLLYHAFDASLSKNIISNHGHKEGVGFYGSLIAADGFHSGRIEILSKLAARDVPLKIYSDGEIGQEVLARQLKWLIARVANSFALAGLIGIDKNHELLANNFPHRNKKLRDLIKFIHAPKFGIDMFRSLAKNYVGLNYHIDIAAKAAANMRIFETVGVGTCLVTDYKENIKDLFEPDYEIVTYKNIDECSEKLRWLIDNPIKCAEIANAGNKRLLRGHTYEVRMAELNKIILGELC